MHGFSGRIGVMSAKSRLVAIKNYFSRKTYSESESVRAFTVS
jgi:hypothetical protein